MHVSDATKFAQSTVISAIFKPVFQCETVLEIEPNNVKAFYRRGLSLLAAGEPNSALDDFNKVHFPKDPYSKFEAFKMNDECYGLFCIGARI